MLKKGLIMLLLILAMLSGCGKKEEIKVFSDLSELNGENMGCMSGSIFDELIAERFPDSQIIYYSSRSELLLGLSSGKIAGFVSDEPVAMMMVKANEGVTYLDEAVGSVDYGICFSSNAKDKLIKFNEYLAKITANGHLEELQKKWIDPEATGRKKADFSLSGENGTLRCVTTPDAAPFSFMADGKFEGYEVELLYEFASEYGYDLEINTVSFDALLTAVAMNKYDIGFNGIFITPERAKSVSFTTPTYSGRDVVMISNGNKAAKSDLFTAIKDSIYKNFIEEDRYLLLLNGALTTIEISLCSIVAGTLFGLLLYILSTRNSLIRNLLDLNQRILAKLPAVVLLMILFYVIFKTSSLNGTIVSIIGFAFIFGNTVYALLKTGVKAVDYGQKEASLALGYGEWLSFFHIILPQALKTIADSYLHEIIALIKNTSIVGYVSVTDVTRASDIIRGRTYDALFPLIVVALLYYLTCSLLIFLIRIPLKAYIERKVKYNDQI